MLMLIVTTKFNINLTVFVYESLTFKTPVLIINYNVKIFVVLFLKLHFKGKGFV